MAGSQLSQLKAALSSAGVGRGQGERKGMGKKHSKTSKSRGADSEARAAKLDAIRESLNRFDVKTTRTKHAVLGAKPLKGSTGRPGLSKQAGIENRKKTLLPQWLDRNRAGAVIDRRFGEDDPNMTPEDKALQRFTFERQRKAGKASVFNLGDDDDEDGRDMLTHYGQSLSTVKQPLADQEDLFRKSLTSTRMDDIAAGPDGLEDGDGADAGSRRKKSRAEVMEEVMAKSKAYKYERQKVRTADEDERLALDDELAGIRGMLGAANRRKPASPSTEPEVRPSQTTTTVGRDEEEVPQASTSKGLLTFVPPSAGTSVNRGLLKSLLGSEDSAGGKVAAQPEEDGDMSALAGLARNSKGKATEDINEDDDSGDPYDRYVRELAFEKRAAPSDRLKSEHEAAQEAADALQRAEAARRKRMLGLQEDESGSDDDDHKSKRRKGQSASRAAQRLPQGDDLDDDYGVEGDELQGFSLGLGGGLVAEEAQSDEDEASEQDESEEDESADEFDSDQEDSDSEASEADRAENEMLADILHRDAEVGDAEELQAPSKKKSRPSKTRTTGQTDSDLPFTFPCPEDHSDLLELLEGHEDALPTLVERVQTLYHPSLAEGNKQKLSTFLGVLIDHTVYSATQAKLAVHVPYLGQQIYAMTQSFPISSATFFMAKLKTMQRNLLVGLQAGPASIESRTWPGPGELTLLRLVGLVWSSSDFSHPITTAASLLMAQYLAQCRVRHLGDVAAGLFLCSILVQYEHFSKRLLPECLWFINRTVPLLFLGASQAESTFDESHPICSKVMKALSKSQCGLQSTPDIYAALAQDTNSDELRTQLSYISLSLRLEIATMQASLPAFIECFEPVSMVVQSIEAQLETSDLKAKVAKTRDGLERMLRLSKASRRPLMLQQHKPVPIPSFIPKFEEGYAPGRRFDPDSARNEAAKLKALVKKERKGAIRELRKDTRFLAGEQARAQRDKDKEYKSKIDRITAGLQEERGEEKRFERTKEAMKKRDKQRSGGRK